jgi:uncharacterized protein with beta-barrel porin domain
VTKNRFLSKKLTCLLTTALVSTSIFTNIKEAKAIDFTIATGITVVVGDNNGATEGATPILATDAVTVAADAAATFNAVAPITIASLTFSAGTAPSITVDNGTLTISGNITNANLTGLATATITITTDGVLTLAGSTVLNAVGLDPINVTFAHATASILNLTGAGQTQAATFNGATANLGRINITGTQTFNGAIGATQSLQLINIDAEATFNSTVSSNLITVDANTTFGGAVTAGTSITLATAGTEVAFASTVTTPTLTVGADTTAILTGVLFANLAVVVDGTLVIGAPSNEISEITLNAGGIIVINKTLVSGNTISTGVNQSLAGFNAGGQIILPSNLTGGQTLIIRDIGDIEDDVAAQIQGVLTNNALSTYTAVQSGVANDTEIVTITSINKSASTTASELGVNTNKAIGLLQARDAAAAANTAGRDTAAIDAIFNVLNAVGEQSATADTNFANQVAPQTDTIAGSSVAAKAVTSGVQNIMSTRLASLRSGDGYSTGVVTGSGMSANSGFIQAFGSTVEQKNKGNEFGYDADTTGFALGVDGKVSDGVVLGISYANSKTDVDGKGTGKAKNDIKTNAGSLYADYTTKDGYVEGSITYGQSDNKGSRILNTGGLNRTYKSDYDSEQYSFRLSGGVPINLGAGAFFTPFAGATISQIKTDAYTETSTTANDALRLRVSQDTVDSQVGTIGVKYHQAIKDGKTTFTPEVKLAVNQEFGDDTITSTNTYQGGGASFKNSTAIEKTSATAGVGLNITSDNVSFNIGYEADAREKYLGHSAQAKITAKF